MDAHALELVRRQPPRLRQDVLGDRELADVVQQRGDLHAFHFVRRHACRAGELRGSGLHAADVVVVRTLAIDQVWSRASIARASASTLAMCRSDTCFTCSLLLFDAAQIDPVAPIRQIQGRCRQQHHPDLHRHHDANRHDGHAGANEARGRGPEEVLLPEPRMHSRRESATAVATSQLLQRKKAAAAPTAGWLSVSRSWPMWNPPSHVAVGARHLDLRIRAAR